MFPEIFLAILVIVLIVFVLSMLGGSSSAVGAGIWFFIAEATYKLVGALSSLFVCALCLLVIYWATVGRF